MVSEVPVTLFLPEGERYFDLELFLIQQALKPNTSTGSLTRERRDTDAILYLITRSTYTFLTQMGGDNPAGQH